MRLYVAHGNSLNLLREAWGLPFDRVRRSDAILIELREHDDGQLFVNARYLNRLDPAS